VPIYQVGEYQGMPYFSMKLIESGSLAQRQAEWGLVPDPGRAEARRRQQAIARMLASVARAVHHAHQRGILHRDLKPANILLDDEGRPHVTDFGLAKRVEGDRGLTQTGAIVGTPSYMAPEQAVGAKVLTTQADVYSLGAILYELLTGRPPFKADNTLDTLLLVRQREPVRPRVLASAVDRDLETICLKCLAKEPERRSPSAEALADDLENFCSGRPVTARPTPAWEKAARWARRRPALAGLLGVSVAAVLALLAGGLYFTSEVRGERDRAVGNEQWALEQKDEAERLRKRAERGEAEAHRQLERSRQMLFSSQLLRAALLWEQEPDLGRALLEDVEACPPGMRDFAWGLYHHLCQRERLCMPGHREEIGSLAFAEDGKVLASGSGIRGVKNQEIAGQIKLWDMPSGRGPPCSGT
jgi:eukaryotic-like serine/threonine-protein kinase